MSTPIYFTCGAFVCDAEGDAHELVTCIFDARKTSRRRAKQRVTRLVKAWFPMITRPHHYQFKGMPCDTGLTTFIGNSPFSIAHMVYPDALADVQVMP